MEQVKIEVDGELSLALQKIHECQTIYMNVMAEYEDSQALEDFSTHCDCIIHIVKEKIADNFNCQMEDKVGEEYERERIN